MKQPKKTMVRKLRYRVKIKELRAEMGYTQRSLALAVGSTCGSINDAEHGREITLRLALKIATVFGKTIPEIWQPLPEDK